MTIDSNDEFLRKKYRAVVNPSNKKIRSYDQHDPYLLAGQPLIDPLRVREEFCYNITIPITDYQTMVDQLQELETDRVMRQRDPQLKDLYVQYKTWLNLKR